MLLITLAASCASEPSPALVGAELSRILQDTGGLMHLRGSGFEALVNMNLQRGEIHIATQGGTGLVADGTISPAATTSAVALQ